MRLRLIGANQRYIDETTPYTRSFMCDSVEQILDYASVVVIGQQSTEIRDALKAHGTVEHYFLDLVKTREVADLSGEYGGAVCES